MTSPEVYFKELTEKIRNTLPDQQINGTTPAKTKKKRSRKIEKLKQSKQTKKIYSLLKLLKLLYPLGKSDPSKHTYLKNKFKTNIWF